MNPYSSIELQALELNVKLGWPKAERLTEQIVFVDVIIRFMHQPLACTTDQLADTYCYHHLINKLKEFVITRHFRLIEHLGYELYQLIKQAIPTTIQLQLRITKKPLIAGLTGGVTFCYGDTIL
jgi:dihydroneopterin aldolase